MCKSISGNNCSWTCSWIWIWNLSSSYTWSFSFSVNVAVVLAIVVAFGVVAVVGFSDLVEAGLGLGIAALVGAIEVGAEGVNVILEGTLVSIVRIGFAGVGVVVIGVRVVEVIRVGAGVEIGVGGVRLEVGGELKTSHIGRKSYFNDSGTDIYERYEYF